VGNGIRVAHEENFHAAEVATVDWVIVAGESYGRDGDVGTSLKSDMLYP
jgi:hypothetical protein